MSKRYCLTHGIIIATAILVVLFEVLPLTSCMCGTAKRMTVYKQEDEHVMAVVPLMGNNVLLNENTSLPATKNNNSSSTSDIRIEEEGIVEALEKDARRRGISIRSLVNDVLRNYVTSDKYPEEAGKEPLVRQKMDVEEEQKRATVNSTRILVNHDEIIKEIKRKNNAANKLSICTGFGGMQMSYNYLFDSYKNVVDKYRRKGEGLGLRWITNINKDNLNLLKIFLESGIRIRHIKDTPSVNFGVSDKEVALTIEKMEDGSVSQSFLISNEPSYVNHFDSLFEELWKNGIDAEERIKDIEEGIDLADIRIIQNPNEGMKVAWDLLRAAKQEIWIMASTPNAFRRQVKMGVLQLLKGVTEQQQQHHHHHHHHTTSRILIPYDEQITQTINEAKLVCPQVDFRILEEKLQTRITIILIDRRECLIVESKDDTRVNPYDAIGLSTYSNSKSIVLSYASIFESLWKQTELYEQLKVHAKMQKEFINIAAHELRTPIQPILGLTQVLRREIEDIHHKELIDVVIRNAKRLQQLSEDILDVTRIESQSLQLKKEQFNLNDVITNSISELMVNSDSFKRNEKYNAIKLLYKPTDIFVQADKARIHQVINILLCNAFKFTKEGSVSIITTERKEEGDSRQYYLVSIKDTGTGIHPEILPRLFTKFATKSDTEGTGLGLFISKSIVEAHGGRIWGGNNTEGKGATFAFSLPIFLLK